jgi:hypothetical protein
LSGPLKSYPDGIFAAALQANPERFKIHDAKISKLLSKRSQAGSFLALFGVFSLKYQIFS